MVIEFFGAAVEEEQLGVGIKRSDFFVVLHRIAQKDVILIIGVDGEIIVVAHTEEVENILSVGSKVSEIIPPVLLVQPEQLVPVLHILHIHPGAGLFRSYRGIDKEGAFVVLIGDAIFALL